MVCPPCGILPPWAAPLDQPPAWVRDLLGSEREEAAADAEQAALLERVRAGEPGISVSWGSRLAAAGRRPGLTAGTQARVVLRTAYEPTIRITERRFRGCPGVVWWFASCSESCSSVSAAAPPRACAPSPNASASSDSQPPTWDGPRAALAAGASFSHHARRKSSEVQPFRAEAKARGTPRRRRRRAISLRSPSGRRLRTPRPRRSTLQSRT